MASKDLHDEAFDEATITKLEIFEKYLEAWLPTFIMAGFQEVNIYDSDRQCLMDKTLYYLETAYYHKV